VADRESQTSRPARTRGLKPNGNTKSVGLAMSRPARARGLKHVYRAARQMGAHHAVCSCCGGNTHFRAISILHNSRRQRACRCACGVAPATLVELEKCGSRKWWVSSPTGVKHDRAGVGGSPRCRESSPGKLEELCSQGPAVLYGNRHSLGRRNDN
jgi:hypothetical protein